MQNQILKNNGIIPRPPIVVVMGHIDHGKSSILDYIRKANIVAKEAGGITQHIGAYEAEVKCGDPKAHNHKLVKLTFLDTPGHEAFSQMRARGAKIADIAVLVVAADDGVKPQTVEAYNAIKTADIPFVVAINKMDKPGANPEMVKKQLADNSVYVEGWGGNVPFVNTIAKTGEGIQELLDMILLMAEMENLTGNSESPATGFVIESHMDPKRGNTATLLIMDGIMKKGDYVVTGKAIAPVRIFENFQGVSLEEATFSSPVRITGFDNLPEVGAPFTVCSDKGEAEKCVAENCADQKAKLSMSNIIRGKEGELVISLLVKTDVSGTLEALEKEIKKQSQDGVVINIVRDGVGKISESDVKHVSGADKAIIIGFNVGIEDTAKMMAERFGMEIFMADIIYKISEWLGEQIKKRKPLLAVETVVGTAKILKTFSKTKTKQVLGGKVMTGKVIDGSQVVIKRRDAEIGRGRLVELQHNKSKAKEVEEGNEFGMMVEAKIEIVPGDMVEFIAKIA